VYCTVVWGRRALNTPKRRFPARAAAAGTLVPSPSPHAGPPAVAAGSGPRSFTFNPARPEWCYLITEIDSTIVPLR
jgi:hypothetical protein